MGLKFLIARLCSGLVIPVTNNIPNIDWLLCLQAATHIFGAPSANQNPFGGQSLQYTGGTDPNNKNYSKLSQKLNEADIERRKIQEEAERRERAAEIRREERLAKIQYMHDMPDNQPAGTGECPGTILFAIAIDTFLLFSADKYVSN